MNRSIEQALLSLLPTHSAALPQALTELASSLLTQSRHRASTLKAEEELARPYACAHLACDRLKVALDLPPIEPRPPVPPRIYKRLYNHLDKILPAPASTPSRGTPAGAGLGSGRIRTPSTKLREQQQQQQQQPLGSSPLASKSRGTPSRTTPGKDKSLSQLRNPTAPGAGANDTPSRQRAAAATPKSSSTDPLPRWIRPTLRFLCARLGPPSIGPVVAAALESVIAPRGRPSDDAWVHANLAPVVGALYLYVWRAVTWPGRDVDRERYVAFRREVAACLERARRELAGELADEDAWEGWAEAGVREFDAAMVRGNRHGWFEMDWVSGVEDLVERERANGSSGGAEDDGEGGEGDEGAQDSGPAVKIRRPDTMLQERYDYLSERKRKAYAEWKTGILKRIKELEAR